MPGRFCLPQISHLVNEGTGRNHGVELTVEKFFSRSYYALFTTSLFKVNTKAAMASERNTTFNNEYVINALFGKEWKINNKWMLTTDMKFPGGRYVTPIPIWLLRSWRSKKCCSKTRPLPKTQSLPQDGSQSGVEPTVGAGPVFCHGLPKSYQSPKRLLKRYKCHCRSHRYSIPNWIFSDTDGFSSST